MYGTSRKIFERYLSEDDERQLFQAVDRIDSVLARRDAAWMRLLRHTGIRVGTLAGLTVGDAQKALRHKRLELRPEITKRKQAHVVFLNQSAAKALRKLMAVRKEMGYSKCREEPLIMSRNHKRMSIRSFQARVRFWVAEAGLSDDVSPHWFRHTLAKRIIASSTSNEPLALVKGVLGHVSWNSTAVYTAPDKEELLAAMENAR